MNISKLQWIAYPILIGFGLAYLITGGIEYRVPSSVDVQSGSGKSTVRRSKVTVNRAAILDRNMMNLKVPEKSAQISNSSFSQYNTKAPAATNQFSGQLIGILKGDSRSYAVIKIEDQIAVVAEGKERNGIHLLEVLKNRITLTYNDKQYELEIKADATVTPPARSVTKKKVINTSGTEKIEVSDNKVTVPRSVLVAELKDVNKVLKSVLVSPYYKSGEFVGYRMSRLRRSSFFRKIGLKNGDIIVNINGENLSTPEKLFELFGKADDLTAITIDMLRRGKKESLFVEIND